jgi:two-component system response regulator FixJ
MNMKARPRHVAILDDDPSIRVALGRLMKASEMIADIYSTGSQFFDALALKSPDCLVLDLEMPEMNGLAVLRRMQSLGCTLPVIVLTGSSDLSMQEDVLRTGARAFLKKPIDALVLASTIEKAIHDHRASCESAAPANLAR